MSVKETLVKSISNIMTIFAVAGVVYGGWYTYQASERAKAERLLLEERYGKLRGTEDVGEKFDDGSAQLTSRYKEQAEIQKNIARMWQELAVERGERIKSMATATTTVTANTQKQVGADYVYLTENGKLGYTLNELNIAGDDSPPIGYILTTQDGKVVKKNYEFEIKVETVQIKDDLTGKIRMVSRAYLVPRENGLAEKRRPDFKKWKGERFNLNVTGGETEIDPYEPIVGMDSDPGFVYFPFNANVGLGAFSVGADVESRSMFDVTLLGYGINKRDLDWKLMNIGLNYSDVYGIGLHVTPLTYRMFPDTFTNTYTGIGYWSDTENSGYFLGIQVGL